MIHVGMSGWSYDEWVGPFYPVSLRSDPAGWLPFYATRFRAVEINSTFHAFPSADLVDDWARCGMDLIERAGAPFEFSLKLPRAITHEALPAGDLAAAREITGRFDREVLDPLAGEGLLGAILVQLPPSLPASADAVAALQEVLAPLAERQVALEFRDASWYPDGGIAPVAEPLFASRDVCAVELDTGGRAPDGPRANGHAPADLRSAGSTPADSRSARPSPAGPDPGAPGRRLVPTTPGGARHAYVRLHGRKHDLLAKGPESGAGLPGGLRHDYLYAEDELAPWADRVRDLDARRVEVRVFFNNTHGAKGTANALQLLAMLDMAPPVPLPRLTEQTRLRV